MLFAAPPNGKKRRYIFVQIHSIEHDCTFVSYPTFQPYWLKHASIGTSLPFGLKFIIQLQYIQQAA
jgi:hypothetical protein